jgi:hypothetical protein
VLARVVASEGVEQQTEQPKGSVVECNNSEHAAPVRWWQLRRSLTPGTEHLQNGKLERKGFCETVVSTT